MKYFDKNEIEQYNRDGFLVKTNFYDEKEISEIRKWVYDYADKKPENWKKGQEMGYYETSLETGERILTRLENFIDYNKNFYDLIYSKKITDCIEDLLNESCVFFKEKINFKNPGGAGFKPHQDAISRWDDYAKNFMNMLICTDKGTIENGCLEVAPGFHNKGFLGPYDAPIPDEYLKKMKFQPLEHSLGDVVFFDGFTPHQSQENTTKFPRTNVYLTYNRLSEGNHRVKYFTRKRKELPPDNERGQNFKDSPLHTYK
jgi:ectoine hydroxylase-related dioxygenase (phytanoyl-CoA dioxygenase family)